MTGASDTLDPIAAAEAGIVGSKHLIASVANDLSQQERWLAHIAWPKSVGRGG